MKIFIVGAGFTGTQLARALVLERNNVVLVDNDPARVREASDQLDCTVLEADGNDLEVLESAGIASADALVTLTEDDELNMITCSPAVSRSTRYSSSSAASAFCAAGRGVQRDFYVEAIALFSPLRPSSTCTARPAPSRPSNPAASVGAGHAGVSETVARWDSPVCAPAHAQPRAAQDTKTQGPQDGEA